VKAALLPALDSSLTKIRIKQCLY